MNKKIIVVTGPTASGKTRLAVKLAEKFNGEIISADSRQVYRELNIGSGKDIDEYGPIAYHLIDIADAGEGFTLFDWLERSRKCVDEIIKRGKLPIVAGGTGLYVQALVEGFALEKTDDTAANNHKFSREELDAMTVDKLQSVLADLDPETLNKIDQKNPRRLVRAIENTQEGIKVGKTDPGFRALQIGISLPRPVLYEKIDKRVDERFREGMLEEVRGLLDHGVDPAWLQRLGLEYRLISEYITSGSNDFDKMAQDLKWKIHAFARRQMTWLRRFPQIKWVDSVQDAEQLVTEYLKY